MKPREFYTAFRDEYRSASVTDHVGDLIGGISLLILFVATPWITAVLS